MATRIVRTQTVSEIAPQDNVILDRPVDKVYVSSDPVVSSDPDVVATATPNDSKTYTAFKTYQVVYFLFGLIELLLILRFVLKLFGANSASGFVSFIYSLSDLFVAPFFGIFRPLVTTGSVVEWSTVVAMIVYAILAYIIAKVIEVLTDTKGT